MNKCILLILYVWKFVTVQESKKRILSVYVLCIASLFNVLILFLVFSFLSQKKTRTSHITIRNFPSNNIPI